MTLFDKIMRLYPELKPSDFYPYRGFITLRNDSDGSGDYVEHWNHPTFLRPTQEQLDAFIPPQPYPSWVLNEDTCLWEAPVPMPTDGQMYSWDEATTSWVTG